jgi:hypothetical protein
MATWRHWTWAVARTAGFPAQLFTAHLDPATSAAIDAVLDADAEVERAAAAIRRVARSLAGSRADERALLRRLRRREELPVEHAASRDEVKRYHEAMNEARRQRSALDATAATMLERARQRIVALARDATFREAVFLSSATAHQRICTLLDESPARDRRVLVLASLYLQRLTAKYDTVSFFGPQVWARQGDEHRIEPLGDQAIDKRVVHFANWAIDAICQRVRETTDTLPQRRFGLSPLMKIESDTLIFGEKRIELPDEYLALFRRCDGTQTAAQAADALVAAGVYEDRESVFSDVSDLLEQGALVDLFRIGTRIPEPQRALLQLMSELTDERGREYHDSLASLLQLVGRFLEADQGTRVPLAQGIEQRFETLAGVAAHRRAGQTYASRTIFWEDCRRAAEVTLDKRELAELDRALAPVLNAARWVVAESAALRVSTWLERLPELSNGGIDLVPFFQRVADPQLALGDLESSVLRTLQERALQALAPDPSPSPPLALTPEELARRLAPHFPERPAPSAQARFHTVEVQRCSIDNVPHLVLTDLLPGGNALTNQMFLQFCPWTDELLTAYRDSLRRSGPALTLADPPDRGNRATNFLPPIEGAIELFRTAAIPRMRSIPLSQFRVMADGRGGLELRSPTETLPLTALFAESITWAQLTARPFSLFHGKHTPRLTVGRIVVQREQWMFSREDLEPIATEGDDLALWSAARHFRLRHRLPEQVLAVVPQEVLPLVVDFRNPFLVQAWMRWARQSASMTLIEALPATEMASFPTRDGAVVAAYRLVFEEDA